MEKFEQEVWSKVPHREEKDGKVEIVNATPLTDLTEDLKECAKTVYDVDISGKDFKVYGKFDGTSDEKGVKKYIDKINRLYYTDAKKKGRHIYDHIRKL